MFSFLKYMLLVKGSTSINLAFSFEVHKNIFPVFLTKYASFVPLGYFRFFMGCSAGEEKWSYLSSRFVSRGYRSASWLVPEFIVDECCYEW